MVGIFCNRVCNSFLFKIPYAFFIFSVLIAPTHSYAFDLFFRSIEQAEADPIIKFIKNLEYVEIDNLPCILEDILQEFNLRYRLTITKSDWKNIATKMLESSQFNLAEKTHLELVFAALLQIDENITHRCNYSQNGQLDGQVDDKVAVGCVGLLIAGLVGTLGIVFPPAYAAAGAIATYSISEIGTAMQDQSELNRQKKNSSLKGKSKVSEYRNIFV